MNIGERIRDSRKKKNLTQKQLAQKIHVSSQVMSNFERGYTEISAEQIKRIAEELDVSSDYLLGKIASPNTTDKKKYNSIDDLINDDSLHQWLYDLIDENPESIKQMKKVWDAIGNTSNKH
ncbi:helix-turn-helix transcriptional regulator [Listeria booriae]|uniref:helix-turn-helix domain-containing protein n=1 Tax=Listeria booriae TaxID=1552123 RepID=UPI00162A4D6E|nr:helix-turn-helix transcriptional regulator [Listeria booriae]MBC1525473.1 helix-turn-helix transcriptional regulator [Listeria booriae]MBC6150073.1 helix-turn-helix transcriptional regulator [Listeria booriae]